MPKPAMSIAQAAGSGTAPGLPPPSITGGDAKLKLAEMAGWPCPATRLPVCVKLTVSEAAPSMKLLSAPLGVNEPSTSKFSVANGAGL